MREGAKGKKGKMAKGLRGKGFCSMLGSFEE